MPATYDIVYVKDIHEQAGFVFILGRDEQGINEAWVGCPGWIRLLHLWNAHASELDFALVTAQQLDPDQAREVAAGIDLPCSVLPEGVFAVFKRHDLSPSEASEGGKL